MYLSSISSRLLLHDTNSWDLKKSYGCYDGLLRHISWSDDSKYILQVFFFVVYDFLATVLCLFFAVLCFVLWPILYYELNIIFN